MSRRSARLVSGGYYQSDEDSDSSSVSTVSYRESPVRFPRKRSGGRKTPSSQVDGSSSRTVRSSSSEPLVTSINSNAPSALLQSSQDSPTTRTVPFASALITPRPALALSSASCPSRISEPIPSVAASSETKASSGPPGSTTNQCTPVRLSLRGIDSSGYSSAEDQSRRSTSTTDVSRNTSSHPHATTLFNNEMEKALCFFLLFIITCLSIALFSPLLTSRPKTSKPLASNSQPFSPVSPPVVDPALVSAVIEKKIHSVLADLTLKQERLSSELEERWQRNLENVRAKLEAVASDGQLLQDKGVAELSRKVEDLHSDQSTASDSLHLRIQAIEEQHAKLSQELMSLQMNPPVAPCPSPRDAPPIHTQPSSELTPELLLVLEQWFTDRMKEHSMSKIEDKRQTSDCGGPIADTMADFALESQGASVVSTRCSETYRIRTACVTLFGFPLWYPSESPRTIIQGYPVLLPGKCWAFHGVQGSVLISLSHPVRITHVTLDHLPRYKSPTGRIDSAPKDFQVYGLVDDSEAGTLLGEFTYDHHGESSQTFELPNPSDLVYIFAELRVLSNWGHMEYTCVYRFRVHGKMAST